MKFDGYRLLARLEGDDIRLITRGEQDWTERLGPLAKSLQQRFGDHQALVDGELVHVDEDGLTHFGPLQAALAAERPDELVFYAFDLLWLDGHDLRALPLLGRKELLAELLLRGRPRARAPVRAHRRRRRRAARAPAPSASRASSPSAPTPPTRAAAPATG
ncbi:hypothetical protein OV079_39645 [Nannocystis pusilla]|uniref:ATP-dependent DNA ligase family profile domain-containing protein n=1 Tax=Nannocystis pusilla TaxID=889268 RepID=A0A9X3J0E2_9BACT|nr:hypothetical protein [Nannocystis pusilla]